MADGKPFQICGPGCPASGPSRSGSYGCWFGTGTRDYQGPVQPGTVCQHQLDRRLLRRLDERRKRRHERVEDALERLRAISDVYWAAYQAWAQKLRGAEEDPVPETEAIRHEQKLCMGSCGD